jgi:hypothetical protein
LKYNLGDYDVILQIENGSALDDPHRQALPARQRPSVQTPLQRAVRLQKAVPACPWLEVLSLSSEEVLMPYDLLSRRELIWDKLYSRSVVEDNGFVLNGSKSFCLIWQGPTSGTGRGGGYGRMCLDGQTVAVHLVAWTNEYGFIPGKKQLDHLCNQRLCWNPAHLELVTHKTNQRRRDKRARLTQLVSNQNVIG